jgi:uncharacterized protein YkwD
MERKTAVFVAIVMAVSVGAGSAQQPEAYYNRFTTLNFRQCADFQEAVNPSHPDTKRLQAVIFFLTNETRLKNNLLPLDFHEKLEKAAEMHAGDMVSGKFFSHFNVHDPKKKTPNDRARLSGISNPSLAENIIEGFVLDYTSGKPVYVSEQGVFSYKSGGTPLKPRTYLSLGEALLRDWMNSREHKKNILSREARQLGCGVAFYTNSEFNEMPSCMAVQDFQWYNPVR